MILRRSLTYLLIAASAAFSAPSKSAPSALKEIRKKYKATETFSCRFREVFEWKMTGESTAREGSILIGGEKRFRIETPEQLIIGDGAAIYRHNKLRGQVMIEGIGASDALLPAKLMLDFAGEFEAGSLSPLAVENAEGFRLDLKPLDREKALVSEAMLWATTADYVVRRIQLVDLSGNQTTYYLTGIEFGPKSDPGQFQFNIPPGVELFDLR